MTEVIEPIPSTAVAEPELGGYSPDHRGNGYAHALLAALVDEAKLCPDVNLVRATISPDNAPSLAVIRRGHFVHVGEQWDEVDGLELDFERQLRSQ